MARLPGAGTLAAAIVFVGCSLGANAGGAATERIANLGTGPATATAQARGFLLELWVDRQELDIGQRVLALARVTNTSDAEPNWETNICGGGVAPIEVLANAGLEQGRLWDGNAAKFKRAALEAMGARLDGPSHIGRFAEVAALDPRPDGVLFDCAGYSDRRPFPPGQVVESVIGWDYVSPPDVPVPAGEATLVAAFSSDAGKVSAETTIGLIGGVEDELTIVDYVDAALAVPEFRAWLEDHPRDARMDPLISYWPNDAGVFPRKEVFAGVTEPVISVGAIFPELSDGGDGSVVLDLATARVIGISFSEPPDPGPTPAAHL